MRRVAAQALGDTLASSLNLAAPPMVLSAPPSGTVQYPAMAIVIDGSKIDWHQDWELEAMSDNQPLVGSSASLGAGTQVAQLGGDSYVSRVGTLHVAGRIWVATRHPSQREDLEDNVILAFAQDRSAHGRVMVPLKGAMIGQFRLPWDWYAAVTLNETSWTEEFLFSERLWSWSKFDMDLDMLVQRNDPLAKQLILDEMIGVDADINDPNPLITELKLDSTTGNLV